MNIKVMRPLNNEKYAEVNVVDENVVIDLGSLNKKERFAFADVLLDGINEVLGQFCGELEEWEASRNAMCIYERKADGEFDSSCSADLGEEVKLLVHDVRVGCRRFCPGCAKLIYVKEE